MTVSNDRLTADFATSRIETVLAPNGEMTFPVSGFKGRVVGADSPARREPRW